MLKRFEEFNLLFLKKRNGEKAKEGDQFYFAYNNKEDEDPSIPRIGAEIESKLRIGSSRMIKDIKDFLRSNLLYLKWMDNNVSNNSYDKVRKRTQSSYGSRLIKLDSESTLNDIWQYFIGYWISPIVLQQPHRDSGGWEQVICPMSNDCLMELGRFEYRKIFAALKLFGSEDKASGVGVHLHIDSFAFGKTDNRNVQKTIMENFLYWLLLNKYFMEEYCGRNPDDFNKSCMDAFCGNINNSLSAEEALYQFYLNKGLLLNQIETNQNSRELGDVNIPNQQFLSNNRSYAYGPFNMVWNANGKGTTEFRWFGTTNNYYRFMSWMQWYFSIIECMIDIQPYTSESGYSLSFEIEQDRNDAMLIYLNWLRKHKEKYPYVWNDLLKNIEYTKGFFEPTDKEVFVEEYPELDPLSMDYNEKLLNKLYPNRPIEEEVINDEENEENEWESEEF